MIKDTGQILYKHLNFSADGRSMAYSAVSTANNIWSMRISPAKAEATGPPEALTHDTKIRKSGPLFSPDGTRIAYFVGQIGAVADLWLMDSDGRNSMPMTRDWQLRGGWFSGGERLSSFPLRTGMKP